MRILGCPNTVFVEVFMPTRSYRFIDPRRSGLVRFVFFWHSFIVDRYSHCMRAAITPPPAEISCDGTACYSGQAYL